MRTLRDIPARAGRAVFTSELNVLFPVNNPVPKNKNKKSKSISITLAIRRLKISSVASPTA